MAKKLTLPLFFVLMLAGALLLPGAPSRGPGRRHRERLR